MCLVTVDAGKSPSRLTSVRMENRAGAQQVLVYPPFCSLDDVSLCFLFSLKGIGALDDDGVDRDIFSELDVGAC